ncbi:MAG: hypothetical protein M1814_003978 [Vezdaea aestivalis]|nr:MAG: hypothetical protein M1814_003978 [Vezdaea aestivalis]
MQTTLLLSLLILNFVHVLAFPSIAIEAAHHAARDTQPETKRCPFSNSQSGQKDKRLLGVIGSPGFDAASQRIDVSGSHAFVPPNFAAGEVRGPCPGLNALANHNYLPHNGWASLTQYVEATNRVFGMGIDLATFLSTYSLVIDGNPLGIPPGWSMGGPVPGLGGGLLSGLLGQPKGLTGSHNKQETDASPTHGDLYAFNGNNYDVQLPFFTALYDLQKTAAVPNYNLDVLFQHRQNRLDHSKATNPNFFYGPFTGILISAATHTFIYRFMANKSAEHPEGILDKETLKSFFGITGPEGNLVANSGQERIPENWYRRAIGDEYTIPFLSIDIIKLNLAVPDGVRLGGNTGTPNSFVGLNLGELTGGVYNAGNILQGNNAQCLAYQAAQQAAPDILKGSGLLADITRALGLLNKVLNPIISQLACPKLEKIDREQFNQFPGFRRSGGTSGGVKI